MFRITVHDDPESLTFRFEGRLTGPWVQEASDCWQRTRAAHRGSVLRFDLTGLTMVDAAGKAFLIAARDRGAELVAAGCLMRAIVADLTNSPPPTCESPEDAHERKA